MLKCLNKKYYPYCKNLNMLIQIKGIITQKDLSILSLIHSKEV